MIEENDDHIDKREWIKWTDKDPIIKPERVAMADMRIERDGEGDIRFAQAQVRNILNFLRDRGIITDDQHHDGGTFQIWRDMHQAQLGLVKPVSSGDQEALEVRLRAYGYVLLIRRLHPYDIRAIALAVDTTAAPHFEEIAFIQRRTYRRAFDSLSRLLPHVKEQIHALEGMEEAERESWCEGNLKKLIAELVKRV